MEVGTDLEIRSWMVQAEQLEEEAIRLEAIYPVAAEAKVNQAQTKREMIDRLLRQLRSSTVVSSLRGYHPCFTAGF